MNYRRLVFASCCVLAGFLLSGCSSRPKRVDVASIDPDSAAARAMELLDADGDALLSDEELRRAPGMFVWKERYDVDADGFISEDEIRARFEKWQDDKLGFRTVAVRVSLNGRPLPGANVVLVPEPYLGDGVKEASGTTNASGIATLSVKPDDLPESLKSRGITIAGVTVGTYKIELSHPRQKLPTTTRDGTPLGQEIARDTILETFEIDLGSPP